MRPSEAGFSYVCDYGVASISRLLQIIGLFCRTSSLLQGSFAKETYHFKEPTNRSHPIGGAAAFGRLLKIISLFCRTPSLL